MLLNQRNTVIWILLMITFLIISCSRKTMSFFFDGVPPETDTTLMIANAVSNEAVATDSIMISQLIANNPFCIHNPYEKKECASCHDKNSMGRLTAALPDLCYKCHEDYAQTNKNLHSPLEMGGCTECHNPHKSKNNKLLKDKMPGICYTCHEDFSKMYSVLHVPVQEGMCMECHDPHASDHGKLLRSEEAALCFNCHDSGEETWKGIHEDLEGMKCTECHNPHGSPDHGLLK